MNYGICPLSVVPVRSVPEEASELLTQMLYGDHFKIIDSRKFYSKIRLTYDLMEGWVKTSQIRLLTEEEYLTITQLKKAPISTDLVSYLSAENHHLIPIVLGSSVSQATFLKHQFEGNHTQNTIAKNELISIAALYLGAPFLSGGKTPFGIDAAGFTQMVYKIARQPLLRTAAQQATQGEALSFIEESEPGDLAFFDNADGIINHVGLIMKNNYIIHVNEKVRIDRLDHTGIFNTELKSYTHQLRVLKKIF